MGSFDVLLSVADLSNRASKDIHVKQEASGMCQHLFKTMLGKFCVTTDGYRAYGRIVKSITFARCEVSNHDVLGPQFVQLGLVFFGNVDKCNALEYYMDSIFVEVVQINTKK
jgi:hypothetical protein